MGNLNISGIIKSRGGGSDFYSIDIHDIGNNYIRYNNGVQICWGNIEYTSSSGNIPITFGQPFKDKTYGLSFSLIYNSNDWTNAYYIRSFDEAGFTFYKYSRSSAAATYVAIGKWEVTGG